MRILHFIDSLGLGGKERQLVELIKGINKRSKHDQLIVCMDNEDFYKPEVEQLKIPIIYLIRKICWDPIVFIRFYRVVKKYQPDVIHTNSMITSFYALPIARLLKIILMNGSIRNAFSSGGLRWRLEKELLKMSDFRIGNSIAGIKSRGFPISESNVVIYNGFDFSRIEDIPNYTHPSEKFDDVLNKKVVGMVAEFSDYKDYVSFILAALIILKIRNDVIFWAVGDGKNLESIKSMIPDKCNGITFLGKRKDVEYLIDRFYIGVLSTYTEGISNSIMEYMSLSKPVIVTEGGGSGEIVIDGKTGFLIPHKKPEIMADKIEYLLNNPDIAKRMGEAGRKRLEDVFSFDKMIDNTLRSFESAIIKK